MPGNGMDQGTGKYFHNTYLLALSYNHICSMRALFPGFFYFEAHTALVVSIFLYA
jgi:hypothetical protein